MQNLLKEIYQRKFSNFNFHLEFLEFSWEKYSFFFLIQGKKSVFIFLRNSINKTMTFNIRQVCKSVIQILGRKIIFYWWVQSNFVKGVFPGPGNCGLQSCSWCFCWLSQLEFMGTSESLPKSQCRSKF